MPDIGSKPCSSRTPLSGSVMPVLLRYSQYRHARSGLRMGLRIPSDLSNVEVLSLCFPSSSRREMARFAVGDVERRRQVLLVQLVSDHCRGGSVFERSVGRLRNNGVVLCGR